MKCPDTQTLLEYQAERLSERKQGKLKEHIDGCSECQHELRFLKMMDVTFSDSSKLHLPDEGQNCLNEEMQSAYLDRTLTKQERADVEKHLAQCDRCLSELASLHNLVKSIEREGVQRTPDWLLERAGLPHIRRPWWQIFFRPFYDSPFKIRPAVAAVCLLIAIGMVYLFVISGKVNVASSVRQSLANISATPESVAALEASLPLASLNSVDESITRAITGAEAQKAIGYFRLGFYSAASVFCLKGGEIETLSEYRETILKHFERLMVELNLPASLPSSVANLREDLSSGLYKPEEKLPSAVQIEQKLEALVEGGEKENWRSFWFGKFTFVLNIHAKRELLAPEVRHEAGWKSLLNPKLIVAFETNIRLLEIHSRREILSALSTLRELSAKREKLQQAELTRVFEAAQQIFSSYFGG